MGVINYKHLRYFWAVAREGGIARAPELLHVTPDERQLDTDSGHSVI